jgi:hypothetical protein
VVLFLMILLVTIFQLKVLQRFSYDY